MSLDIELMDGRGTKAKAKVTSRGQLVVGPIAFNVAHFNSLALVATPYNYVGPVAGRQFVIDGIIASSDKNVSATNGADVNIYEANAVDGTSVTSLLTLTIGKLDRAVITQLNLSTNTGVWINAETDDATVNLTIIGYYIDTET